jgi:hypothetical protein
MDAWGAAQLLPELSNFYCHPGKAGGSPLVTRGDQTIDVGRGRPVAGQRIAAGGDHKVAAATCGLG